MKTFPKQQKGLTLIEVIVVISVLVLIISVGLTTDINFLKSDVLKAEQSVIVSSLGKARSNSMNNMFQSPHGFCYIAPNYIIFRDGPGTRCVEGITTNQVIKVNVNIASNANTTFPTPIIFSQLAGTTTDSSIHLSDGVKSLDININHEGTINW